MNVELVIDKNDKAYLLDVGPRNGGNMIPDLLEMIFGVDVVEMSLKSAMGEKFQLDIKDGAPYFATHNLHTDKNGKYEDIEFDQTIEKCIIKKCLYKNPGDIVEYFDNASKVLGIIFLKFDSLEQMQDVLGNINEHINVRLKS